MHNSNPKGEQKKYRDYYCTCRRVVALLYLILLTEEPRVPTAAPLPVFTCWVANTQPTRRRMADRFVHLFLVTRTLSLYFTPTRRTHTANGRLGAGRKHQVPQSPIPTAPAANRRLGAGRKH